MAQGLLERVVKEANTPAAEPSAFNAKLKTTERQLYGIEALSRTRLRDAQDMQARRLKLKYGAAYRPISLDALRTFRTKEGWPAIAIFGLEDPKFEISLNASPYRPALWEDQPEYFRRKHPDEIRFTPDLPKALANCFTDVVLKLEANTRTYSSLHGPRSTTAGGSFRRADLLERQEHTQEPRYDRNTKGMRLRRSSRLYHS
jgi:hypothetical protein